MPIDTKIDGSPANIRGTASWLRTNLQTAVHDCGTQVYRARADAEGGWQGEASAGFQNRMNAGGHGIDGLHADIGTLSRSFDQYADGLQTAQAGMQRARNIARAAGLTVAGDTIENPGPAPAIPPPPANGQVTRPQLDQYQSAVQAAEIHHAKVLAFNEAQGEATRTRGILDDARRAAENAWQDLSGKRYLHATDFTNELAGHLIEIQRTTLKAQAASLRTEASKFEDNYLHSPGGSDQARLNESLRLQNTLEASALDGEVDGLARAGSKIPIVGIAISGAGVGWDIAHGKPPGKAIFSGALGTAGAFTADALAGAAVESAGIVGLAAALTPVGAAIVAGVGVGVLADYAWDHWVPDGVKDKIESGLTTAGHEVVNVAKGAADDVVGAAKSVGHFFGNIF